MGTYLNPGNALFRECLNSQIYVDKTELIKYTNSFMNTENKFICVSRARRFGKSMALKMLAAYYGRGCDSREMFEGLKIGQAAEEEDRLVFEKGLNKYDVLWIDMQSTFSGAVEDPGTQEKMKEFYDLLPKIGAAGLPKINHPELTALQRLIIRDMRKWEDYASFIPEGEESLGNAMLAVYNNTGRKFVLLIDEWDSIFRNYEDDELLQDKYIVLLRNLFKNTEFMPAYALVYMTGILPIKRYGTQSALNNFKEYTMLDAAPLEEFVGFTESETMALYEKYGMDIEKAREWYDGYLMGEAGHVYNPGSVVESLTRKSFGNYWSATGVYESVKKPIERNFDGLKEKVIVLLGGGRCKVNVRKFQNDMVTLRSADDAFTLLIHLGYLGYDKAKREAFIPNKEIRDEFVDAIEGDKWSKTFEAISRSEDLLEATLAGDEETVAACIEKVHRDNTAILTYNNENALSCVIQIAYYSAQDYYMLIREMPTGRGFADVVFLPRKGVDKPAIVLELKWKKDAVTAIDQIKNRHYGDKFKEYFGEVLLVGISYDKDSRADSEEGGGKRHFCRIERVEKGNAG